MPDAQPTLHVVFKTHLDIGFTDLPDKVVDTYFNQYIPGAMQTAQILRQQDSPDRYIWTTGSWLLYEYLETAAPGDRRQVEAAIQAGDLAWHALPFTAYYELMDASLLDFSLSLSQRLDRRFDRQTVSAKMSDVPGAPRALVAHLHHAGVSFLHFGVNAASPLPDVPPVFRWRDPAGHEVIVAYQSSYGDLLQVPGLEDKLYFAFTNDNLGPHSPADVTRIFTDLRQQFPNMQVQASTMDAFARCLETVKASLPVVTAEIGNTWIHGAGSDPAKMSRFRQLSRLRSAWLAAHQVEGHNVAFEGFSRRLMRVPEHTWGLDEKTHLADYTAFTPGDLAAARQQPNFKLMETSWQAERAYLDQAVDALQGTLLAAEAHQALQELSPAEPDRAGFTAQLPGEVFTCGPFELGFDAQVGAINHLVYRPSGRQWASLDNMLGLFRFQSFSAADYAHFLDQYLIDRPDWALLDYARPGISPEEAVHAWWLPRLDGLWLRQDAQASHFILDLEMPAAAAAYGCPQRAVLQVILPEDEAVIRLDLQWFNKPACRLPEALWFSFNPPGCRPEGWQMDVIDQRISPLDVVSRGGRSLCAVQRGIFYRDALGSIGILTPDAPLVAPGAPGLMQFSDALPDLSGGMHINLYNNQWGTNHPGWYGEDARFRFSLVGA